MVPPSPFPNELHTPHIDPNEWVDQYGDVLYRFAVSRVARREVAEDLVQETFLAAYRHRAQFDGKSGFGTWLVAILRRKIVDHHRKLGRSPDLDADPLPTSGGPFTQKGKWAGHYSARQSSPKDLAENREFWGVFHGCLSDMPAHLAQAFQLREMSRNSVNDASKMIGVTPKNLAVRLHRARLLLRQCLELKWFRSEKKGAS